MFPRMNVTNPFQSFAFGVPQYGVGFGGINPLVPHLAPSYASNPISALSGIGFNPYTLGQTPYVHPPYVHPLMIAQLPTTNPTFLPLLTQHSAIGQSPYAIWGNPFSQGISPLFQQGWGQQFGGGIGQLGNPLGAHPFPQQAFGYPAPQQVFGWGAPTPISSPILGVDPITGALIAQQPSLIAQSQLPIRPLIPNQQPDPYQMAVINGTPHYGSPAAGVPI